MTSTFGRDGSSRKLMTAAFAAALLAGCGSFRDLPISGPTAARIEAAAESARGAGFQLIPISEPVARMLQSRQRRETFAESLTGARRQNQLVGTGDSLEISVWEAPPAMLFGVTNTDPRLLAGTAVVTHLPIQVVDGDGSISVPFAGRISAAGHSPREIERRISARLKGKTNQIQVLVRIVDNLTSTVTVVGEVRNSSHVALTPAGERLLDVLARAGGVTQPVNKMTLQITRGDLTRAMPLEAVVRDPRQNVVMQRGDILTALFQPYAFSMLGAAGRNEEVPFEGTGLTLTQALARAGGVNDSRADRRGVFVFRYEDRHALDWNEPVAVTVDGKVPVIFQLQLDNPASFLIAQNFLIRDKDVLYVSNAPAAELQKFLNMVSSVTGPVLTVRALTR